MLLEKLLSVSAQKATKKATLAMLLSVLLFSSDTCSTDKCNGDDHDSADNDREDKTDDTGDLTDFCECVLNAFLLAL